MKYSIALSMLSIAATAPGILSGCGEIRRKDGKQKEEYVMDGIKQIRSESAKPKDPATYSQTEYKIGPESRLLLRLENLADYKESIRTSGASKITVELTVAETTIELARKSLRLCALTRNWMMLATWLKAHPFGSEGQWANPGGDFDANYCAESAAGEKKGTIVFDVTDWYVDHVKSKTENNGLILTSNDSEVIVNGDRSPKGAPRIRWEE